MRPADRDIIAGGTVAALAAAVLVVLPWQADSSAGRVVSSASMPTWLAWALLALGLILALNGVRKRTGGPARTVGDPDAEDEADRTAVRGRAVLWVVAAIAIAVVYTASLRWLGFPIASALALAALSLLFGARHWITVVVPAIVLPAVIYVFFRYAMLVLLPTGRLFG
jgi:hypothetical protein